jgi:hypothetical protein
MVADKEGWHCSWCGDTFKPCHATRATAPLTKTLWRGIKPCKGKIDPQYLARYEALAATSAARKKANKNAAAAVTDYTAKRMAPMIETLTAKKSRGAQSGTDDVPVALTKAPGIV